MFLLGRLVQLFEQGFELVAAAAGEVGVLGAVFGYEGEVFFDQSVAEFGGKAGLRDIKSFGLAEEHLFEVGGVAQHGFGTVIGFAADGFHALSLEDEFSPPAEAEAQ